MKKKKKENVLVEKKKRNSSISLELKVLSMRFNCLHSRGTVSYRPGFNENSKGKINGYKWLEREKKIIIFKILCIYIFLNLIINLNCSNFLYNCILYNFI